MSTRIETYSGLLFDYATPRPEDIDLVDIAQALSLSCRFGGHVAHFYSVAQHALLVCDLVAAAAPLHPRLPALQRAALHHDSHEAYIGDIPTPMKRAFMQSTGVLERMARETDEAIAAALGLDVDLFSAPEVRAADALALRIEAGSLKVNDGRTFAHESGTLPARVPPGIEPIREFPMRAMRNRFLNRDSELRTREANGYPGVNFNPNQEATYA